MIFGRKPWNCWLSGGATQNHIFSLNVFLNCTVFSFIVQVFRVKWWHNKHGHSITLLLLQTVTKTFPLKMGLNFWHNGWVVRLCFPHLNHAQSAMICWKRQIHNSTSCMMYYLYLKPKEVWGFVQPTYTKRRISFKKVKPTINVDV